MILTFAEGQFCASHCAPYASAPHGHDWWVRAMWPASGDYRNHQTILDDELTALDHSDLNALLGDNATNEGVASYLGPILDAVEVEVWRWERGRRFGAIWRKDAV